MSEKTKRSILINSRIAVWIVAGVLFVLGLILVAQGFIDTHNYRDGILQIIKQQTGRDVTIKGKVTVWLLPTPTIYIPGVELRDPASDTPAPAATVDMIKLKVPVSSVFSDHPHISSIILEHPVLELVRARDHVIHWQWLNADLLKLLAGSGSKGHPPTVEIDDGRILYHNNLTDKGMQIDHITVGAMGGRNASLRSSFTMFGHDMRLSVDTAPGDMHLPPGVTPLQVRLTGENNTLELQGGINLNAAAPMVYGKISLEASNLLNWLRAKQDQAAPLPSQGIVAATDAAPPPVLPLKLTGVWVERGDNVHLGNIELDGLESKGAGAVALTWDGWKPVFNADMAFSQLNVDAWQALSAVMFLPKPSELAPSYRTAGQPPVNPLPADVRVTLKVKAGQVAYGAQLWKDATLSAELAEASLTVNGFRIALPGQSTLTLFGIISEGTTGGLRFDGSMETQGKSLRQMLTVVDASASNLPETGFGDFYARSNLFVSAQQMRLSEADVKISDLRLNGGLVAYFDANPRLEADVKLKDINFDYFRDAWRDKEKQAAQQQKNKDFFLKFDKTLNFDWLKKLRTSIDFKVNVDGFTFLERKGDNASFRIFARDGKFGIYDMRFNYPGETMESSFTLDVNGEQPFINITLNADDIDTGYFSLTPHAKALAVAAKGKQLWSSDLIDMSWMQGFNGAFDISIGKLRYGTMTLDNLKLLAKLNNNVVSFQNFSFSYWQGRCGVSGSVYGGQVPGVSISFTLYNADMHDILHDLVGRDNITGRVSVSGTLATSGVNSLSWVSQADSKLVLAGRGVNVQRLNLQGVVDAVAVSRTAADVFNNVNRSLVNGSTEFSVDGNINVKNGLMQTPGITLKSGTITGNLTGEVKLVPWTMELSTLFQFPAMTSETIPTMTVQLSGPVASAELRTDTSSLEAYVAKRIISR